MFPLYISPFEKKNQILIWVQAQGSRYTLYPARVDRIPKPGMLSHKTILYLVLRSHTTTSNPRLCNQYAMDWNQLESDRDVPTCFT